MAMSWIIRRGGRRSPARVVVALVAAALFVVPASPAAAATPDVVGQYTLDGNGWIGTLYIDSIDSSNIVSGRMYYNRRGVMELVSGLWNPSYRSIQLQRSLGGTIFQWYELVEGTHVAGHPVLSGHFTQDNAPGQFPVFANRFIPPSAGPTWTPYDGWSTSPCWYGCHVSAPPHGTFAFDGNGWSGQLYLPTGSATAYLMFDEYGYWEPVAESWNAATGILVLNRNLAFGGVTQTYQLSLSTGPDSTVLGGWFTESDAVGAFPAFGLPLP